MCTIGGNLAQDVRCWYYRYPQQIGGPITCLRKGGKICNALMGDNRYHSLFGAAPLETYPCSSGCPAHIDMPSYLAMVRGGDMTGAARSDARLQSYSGNNGPGMSRFLRAGVQPERIRRTCGNQMRGAIRGRLHPG